MSFGFSSSQGWREGMSTIGEVLCVPNIQEGTKDLGKNLRYTNGQWIYFWFAKSTVTWLYTELGEWREGHGLELDKNFWLWCGVRQLF